MHDSTCMCSVCVGICMECICTTLTSDCWWESKHTSDCTVPKFESWKLTSTDIM